MLNKLFGFNPAQTTVKREILAGITTFLTMSYILAVNPSMFSLLDGMSSGAVFTATALAAIIGCLAMAFWGKLPFGLAPGMGLNAFFVYSVCLGMGYSWQFALTAVLIEGLIFIVLTVTNVREAIVNAIPLSLRNAIGAGIGLFITFIGVQNAGLIVDGSTLVTLFGFNASIANGTFTTQGITVILALVGVVITAALLVKGVKGYMLYGILITWAIGIVCQLVGLYVPNPELGFYSVIPTSIFSAPASLAPTFMKLDFAFVTTHVLDFVVVVFAFLFVDIFDTLGTIIGCAAKADMLDENGQLDGIKGVLLADAIGTTVGAMLGTSTVTTFVESSSGISEGGRTGLTSVTTGILFLLALFFSPLFLTIPSFATAPALIVVGFLMMQQVTKIDWNDLTEAIPCFCCITMMGFAYSISDGIAFGIISYTILKLLTGKYKDLNVLLYILSILFVLKYFLI